MRVPFYRHQLGTGDAAAVANVLASPVLTSGAVGKAVEADLARYFDVPHALLVNSWTNGAVACLLAMGIGRGDEVIVPAMTFIASANVAELIGAKPVFVDVDPETLMMTPEAVARAVTPRTKAVMPVHLYGQMADVQGIRAAVGPDIKIIEDAAHCFEGMRNGARPGAHSDAALFSFYATKNVTCGEGGALITRDDALAKAFQVTRLHGMSAGAIDRYRNDTYNHWDMLQLGMKANLPDLLAALLPEQLKHVETKRREREHLAGRYRDAFAGLNGVRLQSLIPNTVHAWHLYAICVPQEMRDKLMLGLNQDGIGCTVNFRSVPTMKFYADRYKYTPSDFPVSEQWGRGVISLPLFPGLQFAEQDYVIKSVKARLAGLLD
jgi:UDP-4-amino-4-deoxy-L-arabinose-oxoglutarate aminotransferase